MPSELSDQILENAQAPAEIANDQGTVKEHALPDLIAADRYLAGKGAANNGKHRGVRFNKLVPPGSG
jgi:hypothetical protein